MHQIQVKTVIVAIVQVQVEDTVLTVPIMHSLQLPLIPEVLIPVNRPDKAKEQIRQILTETNF